jgi:hypothetical protein
MDNLIVKGNERSPSVDFRFDESRLALSGESYPEDAAAFFGPVVRALAEYCREDPARPVRLEVALTYFNTSTAKALMTMFQILDDHGRSGAEVRVTWAFQQDDEMMKEFGEDFSRDVTHVQFHLDEIHA